MPEAARQQAPLGGSVRPGGAIGLTVIRGDGTQVDVDPRAGLPAPAAPAAAPPRREWPFSRIVAEGFPRAGLPEEVNRWRRANLGNLMRGSYRVQLSQLLRLPHFYGAVYLRILRGDGEVVDLGLASLRVVTTAGVNKIVAGLNASDAVTFGLFKFHGFGIGTTAEASGDTALVTELTTEYATDNVRPTGSQTTGGSSNIYRSVATLSPDSGGTLAITEHGLLSQAAVAGGTLLDRSKFTAVNLVAGADSLQVTYDGTFAAGG